MGELLQALDLYLLEFLLHFNAKFNSFIKIFSILIIAILSHGNLNAKEISIAILELTGNGLTKNELSGLTNRLQSEIFKTEKFSIIERAQINEILKEQGFQQSGCTNTECAVEIGQVIGVNKIILGSIDKIANIYALNLRIVDVATAKIEGIAIEDCNNCELSHVLKTSLKNAALKLIYKKNDMQKIDEPPKEIDGNKPKKNCGNAKHVYYDEGIKFYNQQNYVSAILNFEQFISCMPAHKKDNIARYWIAECYYGLGKFKMARYWFHTVIEHGDGNKIDDAYFRISIAYIKDYESKKAIANLKKLVELYPTSEYAPRARQYIDELK